MYVGVPLGLLSLPLSYVSPKSMSRIRPPFSRMTLPDLMSRWTNPAACTAPAALQTSMPTSAASRGPRGPCIATMSESVWPSTKSLQKPTRPSCWSTP